MTTSITHTSCACALRTTEVLLGWFFQAQQGVQLYRLGNCLGIHGGWNGVDLAKGFYYHTPLGAGFSFSGKGEAPRPVATLSWTPLFKTFKLYEYYRRSYTTTRCACAAASNVWQDIYRELHVVAKRSCSEGQAIVSTVV